jgi:hypothetical protein
MKEGIGEVYRCEVVVLLDKFDNVLYTFHLEVGCLYVRVEGSEIEHWTVTTIFLWNDKHPAVEAW